MINAILEYIKALLDENLSASAIGNGFKQIWVYNGDRDNVLNALSKWTPLALISFEGENALYENVNSLRNPVLNQRFSVTIISKAVNQYDNNRVIAYNLLEKLIELLSGQKPEGYKTTGLTYTGSENLSIETINGLVIKTNWETKTIK